MSLKIVKAHSGPRDQRICIYFYFIFFMVFVSCVKIIRACSGPKGQQTICLFVVVFCCCFTAYLVYDFSPEGFSP